MEKRYNMIGKTFLWAKNGDDFHTENDIKKKVFQTYFLLSIKKGKK